MRVERGVVVGRKRSVAIVPCRAAVILSLVWTMLAPGPAPAGADDADAPSAAGEGSSSTGSAADHGGSTEPAVIPPEATRPSVRITVTALRPPFETESLERRDLD